MRRSDLEYQAALLSKLTSFPARIYEDDELVYSTSTIKMIANPVDLYLDEILALSDRAFCFYTNEGMYYGILHLARSTFIIGPAIASTLSESTIRFMAKRLSVTDEEQIATMIHACQIIRRTSYWTIVDLLRIIDFAITGTKLDVDEVPIRSTQQEPPIIDEQSHLTLRDIGRVNANGVLPFSYDTMNALLKDVEHGDVVAYESLASAVPFNSLDVENRSSIRAAKNSFISAASLICNAAIRGGIHPEYALTLCWNYIQKAEITEDPDTLARLRHEMTLDYVRRVNALRRGKRPSKLEADVYNYVSLHLAEHITTEAIAKSLFLSRGYLSTRFKEETGQSLSDYIREQKLTEAKRLLDLPVYSLAEISEMLGYSSQGHFSNAFKKLSGITPLEYRQRKPGVKAK